MEKNQRIPKINYWDYRDFRWCVYLGLFPRNFHHLPCKNIEWILEHKDYCIEKSIDEKLYLKTEMIYTTSEGLFLRTGDMSIIRLTSVVSDEEGNYITLY